MPYLAHVTRTFRLHVFSFYSSIYRYIPFLSINVILPLLFNSVEIGHVSTFLDISLKSEFQVTVFMFQSDI